ncbi:tRNA pseudouridine(55) synthase TruB [Robiginitalea sp. IMCC43444]|uniref:tRNA pseudouridine(55) synthase TruB n=1 Tax=Robiginitalea sp. IMCC43444 TaxID=3459121 RepID=UPI004040FE05
MEFSREAFLEGQILLIDKPYKWSSFQAVNAIKWALKKAFSLKKIKVGHAGTLDPLATGLLIICTGKKTKTIPEFQDMTKEYTGVFTFGATTPSYDMETEPDAHFPTAHLKKAVIEKMASEFIGEILQQPPVFSALKKDGKRLYEYARSGKEVDVPSRRIRIDTFEITRIELPEVAFRVVCSKGTYIRSLAHDFGKALGSGAYLSALKRTKIGSFDVNKAISPEQFKERLREKGYSIQ